MKANLKCGIVAALIGAVVLTNQAHADGPIVVRTTKAREAPAASGISAIGRTAPIEQAFLFARATGTVAECKVDIGDKVAAGDVLAVIDAPEIAHRIAAAEARIDLLEAKAGLAATLAERGEPLAATKAISIEELDQRRTTARTSAAELAIARAELAGLRQNQEFLTLRAPFDGTIAARRIDRGDHINGDTNTADAWLFHLARLNELRMVLHMPPDSALKTRTGGQATISFPDLPGLEVSAAVTRSSNLIDPRSGTMQVELIFPNPELAIPAGLSGNASFQPAGKSAVLLIPSNAVAVRDGTPKAAIVRNGRIHFQAVKAGRTLGATIEILDGLAAGDEVVISPNAQLRDGDPVTPEPLPAPK
jgi:RND family efflux transporter MFP subunit